KIHMHNYLKKTINLKALVTTTFFSLSVVLSALGQSGEYKVQGTVDRNYDGQFVKLFSRSAAGHRVDSVLISDGGYVFSGSVDEWHTAVVSMAQKESGDRLKIFLSPGDIVLTSSSTLSESEVKGNSLAVEHQILQNAYLDLEYSLIATLDAFMK